MSNLIFPLPLLAKVQPQSSEPSGALATQRALAPSPASPGESAQPVMPLPGSTGPCPSTPPAVPEVFG